MSFIEHKRQKGEVRMVWSAKVLVPLEGWGKWKFHPCLFAGIWFASGFLVGLTAWLFGWPTPLSATMAAWGASGACSGVVTIGRPLIRLGGYKAWAEAQRVWDGGHIEPTPEEIEEAYQFEMDAIAVQVIGPALVIVGTMINGFSGFFF